VEGSQGSEGGYGSHVRGFANPGKTRGAISFVIRGIGVSVPKLEVRRDVAGGLSSKSKKRELVVGGASKLGWFEEV